MSDTDKDIDLLDMFKGDGSTDNDALNDINNAISENKVEDASIPKDKETKSIFDIIGDSNNPGSGDTSVDLMNWFNGSDRLPSDPLTEMLSSAALKAEFGMMFNVIKNFARLKKLQDFVEKAEDVYFSPDEIINLDPDQLKERMAFASNIMKDMYELNRRTIQNIKRKGEDEEMDKLKVMLSAIPSNKLKDIISSLSK